MKKYILLISLIVLSGCYLKTDNDFWGDNAKIINKTQDQYDKDKKQAEYTIGFIGNDNHIIHTLDVIFPENFANVGDYIRYNSSNNTLSAQSE